MEMEETREEMWEVFDEYVQTIIREFPIKIPKQLLNLLRVAGYDNVLSISQILKDFDGKIENLEKFAREDLPDLIDEQDKPNYYGIYTRKPSKFKVLDGYKEIIISLATICKSKTDELLKCPARKKRRTNNEEMPTVDNFSSKPTDNNPNIDNISIDNATNSSRGVSSEDLHFQEVSVSSQADKRGIAKKEKGEEHVKCMLKKYVKKVCQDELEKIEKSVDNAEKSEEDKQRLKYILSEVDLKVDSLKLTTASNYMKVPCLLCEHVSKIYNISSKYGKKWVCSNFNSHFNSHLKKSSKKRNKETSNQSTLSFIVREKKQENTISVKPATLSNSLSNVNIEMILPANNLKMEPVEEPTVTEVDIQSDENVSLCKENLTESSVEDNSRLTNFTRV